MSFLKYRRHRQRFKYGLLWCAYALTKLEDKVFQNKKAVNSVQDSTQDTDND